MNYSSNLKNWGAIGSEYPDNYSYAEGEKPVDEWDNFLTNNIIEDLQHLIGATNDHQSDTTNPHDVTASQVDAPTTTQFSDHEVDSSVHHVRYSDSEARTALDGSTIGSLTVSSQLGNASYATLSDVPTLGVGEQVYVEDEGALYIEDGL